MVGVEVKAGATVRAEDLRGLRLLERRFGSDFAAGIVLCTAPEPRHLGGRLWILPISVLWRSTTPHGGVECGSQHAEDADRSATIDAHADT